MTWTESTLGELCAIDIGKTPLRANNSFWDTKRETDNVWLSIADLSAIDGKLIADSSEYLSDKGASICKPVRKGTLLASFKLSLGKLAFADRDLFTNEAIAALTLREKRTLSSEFLYYFLQFFDWDKAAEGDVKVKGKTLNKAKLKEIRVRFPPLPEQQRIVGILDDAFAGIAVAKANAEQNRRNADALFDSALEAIFVTHDKDWKDTGKPLAELCEFIVDCEHKTAPTQKEGIPSIRTPNIGKGRLLLDGVNRVSEATYREWTRRAEPQPGDLILAREAPAGNVAVIPENIRCCLGQRTVLIRAQRQIFEPRFLALLLLQPTMQAKLLAHSRGATVQHVNMKDIRALRVGQIPSLQIQRDIVARFDAITDNGQHLESLYTRKLAALDELKQSLLHEAFSGAL